MKEKTIQILGWDGRMIAGSKSGYMQAYPNNLVVFNANLIVLDSTNTKLWYGDLDITKDIEKLRQLSAEIGMSIVVLREMDARFENENKPRVESFVIQLEPNGDYELGKLERDYFSPETLMRNE